MFIWPSILQHNRFLDGTQQCTIIAQMRKLAVIGMRDKIDAFNRTGDTPCARHDKTFDPIVGEDGKSYGVVYEIRWRIGNREQWQLGQGVLSRWLVPLSGGQIRHRSVAQVEKQNALATIT